MDQPVCTTDRFGNITYRLMGLLHRTDGPAIIRPDGTQDWCQFGKYHRDDGPAVTWTNGTQFWYQNGKRHRTDGPACIHSDGTIEFWLNGRKVDAMVHFLQRP